MQIKKEKANNPVFKICKKATGIFTKEDIQKVSMHRWRCSRTLLLIRELSHRSTITPLLEWRKAETDDTDVAKDMKQLILFYIAGGNANYFSHFGKLAVNMLQLNSPLLWFQVICTKKGKKQTKKRVQGCLQ